MLTLALLFAIGGGAVIGVLAYLARTSPPAGPDRQLGGGVGESSRIQPVDTRPERRHPAWEDYAIVGPCRYSASSRRSENATSIFRVVPFIFAVMAGEEALEADAHRRPPRATDLEPAGGDA